MRQVYHLVGEGDGGLEDCPFEVRGCRQCFQLPDVLRQGNICCLGQPVARTRTDTAP
jgi:hypothetical protein